MSLGGFGGELFRYHRRMTNARSECRYTWKLLDAGRLMLDGGSMFGVVPRVVWTRQTQPDEKNRVEVRHNCLLLESETPDPKLGRVRRVLIETGTGDKLDEKMSNIFGLDGRTAEAAVIEAGVDPAEIDHVIVSHLHFDHAGGLTRRARSGETPHWVAQGREASGDCPDVMRTFANAEVIVQRREWDDAIANTAVMTRTYYRDHLLPFAGGAGDAMGGSLLRLVESPQAFDLRAGVPGRAASPESSVAARTTEVLAGIGVFGVPGHTWGQQAVSFTDVEGQRVVFVPDVMPSRWHVGAAYSLAYDVEPYTSMLTKRWLLEAAAREGWLLVLDHEPTSPVCRAESNGKGWFDLVDA